MTRDTLSKQTIIVPAVAVAILLATLTAAHAQTFSVIYTFTGHGTSAQPIGGVTVDRHGRPLRNHRLGWALW